ncbi:SGNH/GDSL hydrolase family protein [Granulicella cerasi]|uniref:SGNH/GDSL hydrolase family protein n=2 Tax=Granulicella cerasi TaxID=741063 RepID=A0ABW1ZA59_9BACT
MFALAATSIAAQHAQPWVASWGSSQMAPWGTEPLTAKAFDGAMVHERVRLSVGGDHLRITVDNTFGATPLVLRSVKLSLKQTGVEKTAMFAGSAAIEVPAGAKLISDAMDVKVAALSDLDVTLQIDKAPGVATYHSGARATTTIDSPEPKAPKTLPRWYFLSAVEVSGQPAAATVVALGDSITDGHGATTDGNDRWTDVLARKLQSSKSTSGLGVVNEGIGGNGILRQFIGPSALARFDRDVLSIDGAKYLIFFEGINDIGSLDRLEVHPQADHDALVAQLKLAMTQMVWRAHSHGLKVFGATITPFLGSDYYHPSVTTEGDRTKLNAWIRTSGVFDGVIDFDAVVRDPAHPDHMLPAYDGGDHLHPGPAGYKAMGESIDLRLFEDRKK